MLNHIVDARLFNLNINEKFILIINAPKALFARFKKKLFFTLFFDFNTV